MIRRVCYEASVFQTAADLRLYRGLFQQARLSALGAGNRGFCGAQIPLDGPFPFEKQGKTRAITISGGPGRLSLNSQAQALREQANRVPIVGNVAAGSPILAEECIEDYLIFDTGGLFGEHFALRVRGESMKYAGILPDDLVVVHQQQDAHNGQIVVALFEDEATVKTLRRKDGHTWLMPENPDYEPIDGDGCQILGRVVAVVRRY